MDKVKITGIIMNKEYATVVDNWLICYQNKYGVGIHRPLLECSNYPGIFAFEEEILIGGLTLTIHNDWIFLHCGFVLPEYRGMGIYKKILLSLVDFAGAEGLSGIFTSTYSFEAPHLYERLGFIKGSVMPDCPKGNTSIDYYKLI